MAKERVELDPRNLRVHRGAYYRAFTKMLERRKNRIDFVDSVVRIDNPMKMSEAEFEKWLAIEIGYSMYELRTARLAMVDFAKRKTTKKLVVEKKS